MKPDDPSGREEARARIDALDAELVNLIARRTALVEELFAWKRARGEPLVDETRERVLRAAWVDRAARAGVPASLALAVAEAILAHSRARALE